jgi:hypothetical protein
MRAIVEQIKIGKEIPENCCPVSVEPRPQGVKDLSLEADAWLRN